MKFFLSISLNNKSYCSVNLSKSAINFSSKCSILSGLLPVNV
ncbi:283L [Invertebrate iridescent virus Kaz2018]|uniref:283L n=1 Tax=Invertebrate iridescent virus 6 TaxID=176652 RepID=Q91FP1_IIV6|nr:283L [Invertebrate iridescent virus 6]AAK82144.1 283L [Invertebrate iridescent virus 6]QNH08693.1 283L [Invertebrate iridescent virus Kaz2018]